MAKRRRKEGNGKNGNKNGKSERKKRERPGSPWRSINLSGSTLHGGDVLALGSRLPPCVVGDLLVMIDAGAYTLSRANRFTTLVPPAFILDTKGRLETLRRKETAEDVVEESESW